MIQKAILFLLISLYCEALVADPINGAPAEAESVLLIYTDVTAYNSDLKEAVVEALSSVPIKPQITEVVIHSGDGTSPGFYDELVAQTGKKDLYDWCQVWDLRFRDDKNNQGWTGQKQEDVLTMTGDNSDWELFDKYLNDGGHLYLQGEHHDFYIRNTNLLMFINHIAASPITTQYASVGTELVKVSNFPSNPDNFNKDFNDISGDTINAYFCGGIPLSDIGSGRPLGTASMDVGGNSAMALAYLPSDLKVNDGRVVVNFETNGFTEDEKKSDASKMWLQNVYDLLSGCYRYSLNKTFVPDTLKVNEEGEFIITYENDKQPLNNFKVTDTIPSCIEFISSDPAPSGNSGNVFWWDVPTVATGEKDTIRIKYKALHLPPCP